MLSEQGFKQTRKIPPNSVLVVCIGSTIGKIGISKNEMATNQQINSIICKENIDNEFVYYQLFYNNKKIKESSNQLAIPILNKNDFGMLKIIKPKKIEEQQRIASILSKVDELLQIKHQLIEHSQRLKKGLMQRLLTKGIAHTKFKQTKLGEIPDKWQVRTLEHCVHSDIPITYGIVQAGPNVPGGIPYIRTGDMSAGRLSKDGLLHTSVEIASSHPRSQVKAGEIVCALRGIVGSVLEVPEELEGANLSRGAARISPRHDIYRRYLLWALRSEYARRQFDVFSNGTTFKEITLAQLRTIKVAVPLAIKEQLDLATIFDQLELTKDLRQRYEKKLMILRTGLMQKLLTGKIRVKV